MRPRRSIGPLAVVLAALGVVAGAALAAGSAGESPAARGPLEATAIECAPGDLLAVRIQEIQAGSGYDNPGQAVREFLTHAYPGLLRQGGFQPLPENAAGVRYALVRGGKLRALADVTKVGGSWNVATFSGCNSLLSEEVDG